MVVPMCPPGADRVNLHPLFLEYYGPVPTDESAERRRKIKLLEDAIAACKVGFEEDWRHDSEHHARLETLGELTGIAQTGPELERIENSITAARVLTVAAQRRHFMGRVLRARFKQSGALRGLATKLGCSAGHLSRAFHDGQCKPDLFWRALRLADLYDECEFQFCPPRLAIADAFRAAADLHEWTDRGTIACARPVESTSQACLHHIALVATVQSRRHLPIWLQFIQTAGTHTDELYRAAGFRAWFRRAADWAEYFVSADAEAQAALTTDTDGQLYVVLRQFVWAWNRYQLVIEVASGMIDFDLASGWTGEGDQGTAAAGQQGFPPRTPVGGPRGSMHGGPKPAKVT